MRSGKLTGTPLEIGGLKLQPVALIIAGLRPTNPDSKGSDLRNDALKHLDLGLRDHGIGSLLLR